MTSQHQTYPHEREEGAGPEAAPSSSVQDKGRIGDVLRRVREHRGEDLDSISAYLRIRPDFLYALENNRYDKLPADAYVIGFLRTYANYLGLDGRGAIDQYRREMAGRRRKPQLSMPQPMSEGRAPNPTILIGGALAALLIYGIWYGLSTPDREIVEKPLTLPETIAETTTLPATENNDVALTASGSIFLQTASIPDAIALTATGAPVEKTTTTPQTTAPPQQKAESSEPKADAKKSEVATTAQTPVQPAPEAPTSATSQPAAPEAQPAVQQQDSQPAQPPKPQTFGEKSGARVTIRADKDSWIMITDNKGVTVFDRTLKAGESYNVPANKSLNLTTGNVAGVSLQIDGADMPKLPANGRVARGVPLDPDKLKSRLTAPLPPRTAAPAPADTSAETETSD